MPSANPGSLPDAALIAAFDAGRGVLLPIAPGDASMAPFLRDGDAVWAERRSSPPRPGEILVFRQQDYLVVHRYLGRASTADGIPCLRTRGDHRNQLDPPLVAGLARGRVVAVRRGGVWWGLSGAGARLLARAVAAHALFWTGLGHAARPIGLGGVVAAIDAGLLTIGIPLVFPILHRRIPAPAGADGPKTP